MLCRFAIIFLASLALRGSDYFGLDQVLLTCEGLSIGANRRNMQRARASPYHDRNRLRRRRVRMAASQESRTCARSRRPAGHGIIRRRRR